MTYKHTLTLCSALLCLLVANNAFALGNLGFRAGTSVGLTLTSLDPPEDINEAGPHPWALGPAWQVDFGLVGFEADLLFRRDTSWIPSRGVEVAHDQLSLPMLVKVGVPMVPFLEVGAGIEPRLLIGSDGDTVATDTLETWVWYAPVALGGSFDLGAFELGAELRLELQVSNHYAGPQADEARAHNLMLYVGGFF